MIYAVFAYKPNANPLQIITFCQVWIEFYATPTVSTHQITVEYASPALHADLLHESITSGHMEWDLIAVYFTVKKKNLQIQIPSCSYIIYFPQQKDEM